MKHDSKLTELKTLLPTAKNILIALPVNASIDQLSSGLALFLTFEGAGKQVSIVCDDLVKVGQAHLFGVDHIQKNIPSTDGGNLTLALEGVAASDNTVPALEKLDWFAEGNNLNLVFHVLPGQTFQPSRIVPRYQGSGFNLIFVVGAINLNALGNIYQSNLQAFSGTHVVNIDTQPANTSFGQTNIVDTASSSLSEVISEVITDLGFHLDSDSASNLIAGIFSATNNLTDNKANAETYMAVANCLRVGGRKPGSAAATPAYDWNALMPNPANLQSSAGMQTVSVQPEPQIQTQTQSVPEYAVPTIVASNSQPQDNSGDDSPVAAQPSPEERPFGEGVISETIEPEWLTPKIFKGSSLG